MVRLLRSAINCVNLLPCPIYRLNFIIGMYIGDKTAYIGFGTIYPADKGEMLQFHKTFHPRTTGEAVGRLSFISSRVRHGEKFRIT
jgi:hypothetical protein